MNYAMKVFGSHILGCESQKISLINTSSFRAIQEVQYITVIAQRVGR
jgi:hypothetical protein